MKEATELLGIDRTSSSDLERAGAVMLGPYLRGAYAGGDEPPPDGTLHCVIYNTQPRVNPVTKQLNRGEHWLCEARDTHNNRLVFDSFGRTASHIWQPRLLNVRFTQSDAEQPSHHTDGRLTQWCGAACLAFAKVAQTHGLKIAAHV